MSAKKRTQRSKENTIDKPQSPVVPQEEQTLPKLPHEWLAALTEQALVGIAFADMEEKLLFVNKTCAEMHGYSPEELLGQPLAIFHTKAQLRKEVEPFNRQVLKEGQHTGVVGHRHKDGHTFPTMMSVTLFKDEEGKPAGYLAVMYDITEQQMAM